MGKKRFYRTIFVMMGFIVVSLSIFPAPAMGGLGDLKEKAEGALKKTQEVLERTKDIISNDEKGKQQKKQVQWYTDYQNGKKAAEEEKWTSAIQLFTKAIQGEPRPKTWKVKGVKGTIGYYPYLYLGISYLAVGDFEAAQKNCQLSKEKKVAPKDSVNGCLDSAEKHLNSAKTAKLDPTPTPLPKPTSLPKAADTTARKRSIINDSSGKNGPPGDVYAVIIGVGSFQDERIPPLRFTVNDAQGFYDVLTDPYYGRIPKENVQLLLNEDATVQNIKSAIGTWLKRQAGEDDMAIIYYAGHGASEEKETYWVTHEASIDDLYATALSNNDVADMLARIQSKRVVTFLDSCYSAATVNRKTRTRKVTIEIPWSKFMGEGRVTISASNGEQLSLEIEAYEHGVFTYYLIEGLRGKADGTAGTERDGVIELDELWNYIKNNVTETARKRGNTQTPVFQGSVTARIPLAYDVAYLQELEEKRLQEIKGKQKKLQELFEAGKIRADQFDCAFRMLDKGLSNGYLDGLLAGDISPKTFTRLFKCEE